LLLAIGSDGILTQLDVLARADGAYSECRVIAYAGAYTFAAGAHSRHTYVIECEGHYYPATHGTIADALTDATVKRRVRKAGPPRLL
jgi:hypothetical protein